MNIMCGGQFVIEVQLIIDDKVLMFSIERNHFLFGLDSSV
jgi:hypothetical protein